MKKAIDISLILFAATVLFCMIHNCVNPCKANSCYTVKEVLQTGKHSGRVWVQWDNGQYGEVKWRRPSQSDIGQVRCICSEK